MAANDPLWPITIVRLTSVEETERWMPALRRFSPFALPWIVDDCDEPMTPMQWVENTLSWTPNVWIGVDDPHPAHGTIWLMGGLDDVIPNHSASIHGMAHPILNLRPSRSHTATPYTAKGWMAQALFSAAFDEYRCNTLTATVPKTHAGARGFCLNHGFKTQPTAASDTSKKYTLSAAHYYLRRNAHVPR